MTFGGGACLDEVGPAGTAMATGTDAVGITRHYSGGKTDAKGHDKLRKTRMANGIRYKTGKFLNCSHGTP